MASKRHIRNKRYNRACYGKDKLDMDKALWLARMKRKYSVFVRAYKCEFCGSWHIGHPTQSQRDKLRAGKEVRG
jgi:hypothetical protein